MSALGMIFTFSPTLRPATIFCNLSVCLTAVSCTLIESHCFLSKQDPEKSLKKKCEGFVLTHPQKAWPELQLMNHLQKTCQPPELPLQFTICAFRIWCFFLLWSAQRPHLDHRRWRMPQKGDTLTSTVIYSLTGGLWVQILMLLAWPHLGRTGATTLRQYIIRVYNV